MTKKKIQYLFLMLLLLSLSVFFGEILVNADLTDTAHVVVHKKDATGAMSAKKDSTGKLLPLLDSAGNINVTDANTGATLNPNDATLSPDLHTIAGLKGIDYVEFTLYDITEYFYATYNPTAATLDAKYQQMVTDLGKVNATNQTIITTNGKPFGGTLGVGNTVNPVLTQFISDTPTLGQLWLGHDPIHGIAPFKNVPMYNAVMSASKGTPVYAVYVLVESDISKARLPDVLFPTGYNVNLAGMTNTFFAFPVLDNSGNEVKAVHLYPKNVTVNQPIKNTVRIYGPLNNTNVVSTSQTIDTRKLDHYNPVAIGVSKMWGAFGRDEIETFSTTIGDRAFTEMIVPIYELGYIDILNVFPPGIRYAGSNQAYIVGTPESELNGLPNLATIGSGNPNGPSTQTTIQNYYYGTATVEYPLGSGNKFSYEAPPGSQNYFNAPQYWNVVVPSYDNKTSVGAPVPTYANLITFLQNDAATANPLYPHYLESIMTANALTGDQLNDPNPETGYQFQWLRYYIKDPRYLGANFVITTDTWLTGAPNSWDSTIKEFNPNGVNPDAPIHSPMFVSYVKGWQNSTNWCYETTNNPDGTPKPYDIYAARFFYTPGDEYVSNGYRFRKVDADTGRGVAGAQFQLYYGVPTAASSTWYPLAVNKVNPAPNVTTGITTSNATPNADPQFLYFDGRTVLGLYNPPSQATLSGLINQGSFYKVSGLKYTSTGVATRLNNAGVNTTTIQPYGTSTGVDPGLMTTGADGRFVIYGLSSTQNYWPVSQGGLYQRSNSNSGNYTTGHTYFLVEKVAAPGYVLDPTPIPFVVTCEATDKIAYGTLDNSNVQNRSGPLKGTIPPQEESPYQIDNVVGDNYHMIYNTHIGDLPLTGGKGKSMAILTGILGMLGIIRLWINKKKIIHKKQPAKQKDIEIE
ncbi:MAG: hypothetical protein LBV67_10105 [Streptococcaceae bacterium]|jgi:hypothetical protein|nr:hypothetical protein [Streptococcaceae bacterium]